MELQHQELIKKLIKERAVDEFPLLIKRKYQNVDLVSLDSILAIIGPRRAGKTYFLYQLVEELVTKNICKKADIFFLNFEHPQLTNLTWADLPELINLYQQIYGKKPLYLFFDEIQNVENWGTAMRFFHDQGYKVIISGSSSKLLLNEIGTELRWRYRHRLMLPFSFHELLEKSNLDYETLQWSLSEWKLLNIFDEYLEFWGYPRIIMNENTIVKHEILTEYYTTMFYRDLLERHNIQEKFVLEMLMKYSLEMYASLFSPTKIVTYFQNMGIKISKPTLLKFLDYLKEAFFLIECPKFSYSPKGILTNTAKKYYLIDPWFIKLSANYSANRWKKLENLVAIELYRRWYQFFYFNEKKECDFIVKKSMSLEINMAIQVTRDLNNETQDREVWGLLEAMKKHSIKRWIILTYNQEQIINQDEVVIEVIPVWKFLSKE